MVPDKILPSFGVTKSPAGFPVHHWTPGIIQPDYRSLVFNCGRYDIDLSLGTFHFQSIITIDGSIIVQSLFNLRDGQLTVASPEYEASTFPLSDSCPMSDYVGTENSKIFLNLNSSTQKNSCLICKRAQCNILG